MRSNVADFPAKFDADTSSMAAAVAQSSNKTSSSDATDDRLDDGTSIRFDEANADATDEQPTDGVDDNTALDELLARADAAIGKSSSTTTKQSTSHQRLSSDGATMELTATYTASNNNTTSTTTTTTTTTTNSNTSNDNDSDDDNMTAQFGPLRRPLLALVDDMRVEDGNTEPHAVDDTNASLMSMDMTNVARLLAPRNVAQADADNATAAMELTFVASSSSSSAASSSSSSSSSLLQTSTNDDGRGALRQLLENNALVTNDGNTTMGLAVRYIDFVFKNNNYDFFNLIFFFE